MGAEWGAVGEKGGGVCGGGLALEEDGEGGEYVSACDAAAEMSREQVLSLFALLVQKHLLTGTKVPILTLLALSQGVRLLQRANALLPLDHTILGALRDLLH